MQPRSAVPLAMLTLIICLAGDCLHQRHLLSTGRSHRFGNNNVFHNEKNHVLSVLKNKMFTAIVSYVYKEKFNSYQV